MDDALDALRLTRRAWLRGSALLALYGWAATGARAAAPKLGNLSADALVIDGGLPEAANLARGTNGVAHVELLHDDVAELVYGRLGPAWRARGVRGLVGLTRAPALFLLEPLARDFGLRTVGLRQAPVPDSAALVALGRASERRRPVSVEPMQCALLAGDDAIFAWWMAPVRRPLHAGVTVIS